MRTSDSPKLEIIGTAGLSSASQLVNVTNIPAVPGGLNLTSTPGPVRLRVRIVPTTLRQPVASETTWRRLAITERKKAKRRGFKPSDVTEAVAARRYRR